MKNINILWASTIVENLYRHGINRFFIAPGSRNSPLSYSITSNKNVFSSTHIDERGLGFAALGHAKSTEETSVICITSGTALANLYPAILEAHHSHQSMIILSSDRSFDELYNNSNQTTDQHKLYNPSFVKYYYSPSPTNDFSINTILSLTSTIAYETQFFKKNIIHLNISFKKPLDPLTPNTISKENLFNYKKWFDTKKSYRNYIKPKIKSTFNEIQSLSFKDSFFILAQMNPFKKNKIVKKLIELDIPFYSEDSVDSNSSKQLHFLSLYVNKLKNKPSVIYHLGEKIILDSILNFIKNINTIQINANFITDPNSSISEYIPMDELNFVQSLSRKSTTWDITEAKKYELIAENIISKHVSYELLVIKQIFENIPNNSMCFISNSLPIRHHANYIKKNKDIHIYANRGLSGIDGNIATFLGIAQTKKYNTFFLIIGDISFLHDLNSLLMLENSPKNIHIFLINNGGGAIFKYLPINKIEKSLFNQSFFTPHGINTFKHIAHLFNMNYHSYDFTKKNFKIFRFTDVFQNQKHNLIEIKVNPDTTQQLETNIKNKINSQ